MDSRTDRRTWSVDWFVHWHVLQILNASLDSLKCSRHLTFFSAWLCCPLCIALDGTRKKKQSLFKGLSRNFYKLTAQKDIGFLRKVSDAGSYRTWPSLNHCHYSPVIYCKLLWRLETFQLGSGGWLKGLVFVLDNVNSSK